VQQTASNGQHALILLVCATRVTLRLDASSPAKATLMSAREDCRQPSYSLQPRSNAAVPHNAVLCKTQLAISSDSHEGTPWRQQAQVKQGQGCLQGWAMMPARGSNQAKHRKPAVRWSCAGLLLEEVHKPAFQPRVKGVGLGACSTSRFGLGAGLTACMLLISGVVR
jgi:hypothetical protein